MSRTKTFEMSYFTFAVLIMLLVCLIVLNVIFIFVCYFILGEHPILWILIAQLLIPFGILGHLSPTFIDLWWKKRRELKREEDKISFIK